MFLKNYTSEIPVDTTIARIERLLVNAGANGIRKLYENGQCCAIVFQIQLDRVFEIKLPANVEHCLDALWSDYTKSSVRGRKEKEDFREQAGRTAWKLVQDWAEVQVSLIQLKQVETLEVFMPYVWNGKQTFFEAMKQTGYKALPEKT